AGHGVPDHAPGPDAAARPPLGSGRGAVRGARALSGDHGPRAHRHLAAAAPVGRPGARSREEVTAMKSGLLVLGVIALVVVIGLGWATSVNNRLVAQDQAVQESWAQVQTVYQQRADLVPNMVETVKGFAPNDGTALVK